MADLDPCIGSEQGGIKRTGIYKKSMILLEQIRIIDKSRLLEKLSILEDQEIDLMDRSLRISIGLN